MKLYIAGPMAGQPNHNWPAFEEEAQKLRDAGYEVVSPHELHGTYEEALLKGREGCLRTDIGALVQCDGVATLPGYTNSVGARLECSIAEHLRMDIRSAAEWCNPIVINIIGDIG